jgi:NADP-dependent 3-hydroxy acid dehydrogenase YdfG
MFDGADMNRYLTEFTGTFFLVFTIGCSVLVGTPMAPLAIGASLMVMVYMGGHISGAHYNPAVSLGLVLRGSFAASEYGAYAAAQLLGAVVASLAVWLVTGRTFVPAPAAGASMVAALLVEILYTTALALVVMNVATRTSDGGEFVLWPRHRIHRCRGCIRRRPDFRRRVQSRRRPGARADSRHHRTRLDHPRLAVHRRSLRRRRNCRIHFQGAAGGRPQEGLTRQRVALVTGASSGIGEAFAEVFAAEGFDLVILARREARLHAVQSRLSEKYGVRVDVMAEDLEDPAAPARISADLEARGLKIDVLVNNAGYGVPGSYYRKRLGRARAVSADHGGRRRGTHASPVAGMIERRYGRIINVASLAGLVPAPAGHTLYAASKAFSHQVLRIARS